MIWRLQKWLRSIKILKEHKKYCLDVISDEMITNKVDLPLEVVKSLRNEKIISGHILCLLFLYIENIMLDLAEFINNTKFILISLAIKFNNRIIL